MSALHTLSTMYALRMLEIPPLSRETVRTVGAPPRPGRRASFSDRRLIISCILYGVGQQQDVPVFGSKKLAVYSSLPIPTSKDMERISCPMLSAYPSTDTCTSSGCN
jgi:hypothetical protein